MNRPLIIVLILLAAFGCRDKDLVKLEFLEVATETPFVLNLGEVKLIGRTSGLTQSNADRCGFVWSNNPDSVSAQESLLRQLAVKTPPVGNDSFSVIFKIQPHETVYFRAYAQLGERLVYAREIVSASLDAVVEMADSALVDNNNATVFGQLIGLNALNETVSRYGHVFSASNHHPTVGGAACDTTLYLNANNDGPFVSHLKGLKFNTTYYVRAYAIDGDQPPIYSQRIDSFRVRDGWERILDFPSPFQDGAAVAAANGLAYASFGTNNTDGMANDILKDLWGFNPADNGGAGSWPVLNPFSDALVDKRTNSSMFAIGDTIYSIFGEHANPNVTAVIGFWKYSISQDHWDEATIPISQSIFGTRSGATGFVLNGKIYVGAGRKYISGNVVYLNDFWEYDPGTGNWRKVKSMPLKTNLGIFQYGRYRALAFASDSNGYVGCGDYYGLPVNDFWRFTPPVSPQDSGKWEMLTNQFPGLGRIDGVSFVIGQKAYCGTGWNLYARNLSDFYAFDFNTETWSKRTDFQGGPRQRMIGFAIGGNGYAGTGIKRVVSPNGQISQDEVQHDFWRYTPEN